MRRVVVRGSLARRPCRGRHCRNGRLVLFIAIRDKPSTYKPERLPSFLRSLVARLKVVLMHGADEAPFFVNDHVATSSERFNRKIEIHFSTR